MAEKQLITNSLLRSWRSCKRKYKYAYELGARPVRETEPQFFGIVVHDLIAVWLNAGRNIEAVSKSLREKNVADKYLDARIWAVMVGYDLKYKNEPYNVVALEAEYSAPLINPETMRASQTFNIGGKLDGIYEKDRKELLVERKTTTEDISPESDYWRKLLLDGQVSGYYLGAEAIGHKVESCLYDVIKRPMLRPYRATAPEDRKYKKDGTLYASQRATDETVEEYSVRVCGEVEANLDSYFVRREVPRLESDLADYMADVWDESKTLLDKKNRGKFSRNPEACITVFGTCPYWEVCTGQASIDDETLFVKGKKHRELSEVA